MNLEIAFASMNPAGYGGRKSADGGRPREARVVVSLSP